MLYDAIDHAGSAQWAGPARQLVRFNPQRQCCQHLHRCPPKRVGTARIIVRFGDISKEDFSASGLTRAESTGEIAEEENNGKWQQNAVQRIRKFCERGT